jgi:NAD(P)-dependent dehydrogenase (short-subunit alcohol dehydrogenase family)
MAIITPPITSMDGAFSVAGKNVIVTGGGGGIGLGISTAFAQSGANVAIFGRNLAKAQAAADSFKDYGGTYIGIQCDISDPASVKTAVAEAVKVFGNIDVLVNNAGVATVGAFLEDEGLSEWHRVIDTDLHGVANMIQAVAPNMIEAGKGGRIINISSVGGQFIGDALGHPNSPYFAAKAAVDHFTRNMSIELGEYGIRVNVIAPGPFHSDLDADLPDEFKEHVRTELPGHRFGEPIEIGAYCVFLASPAAAHVTGAICVHDGGMLVRG